MKMIEPSRLVRMWGRMAFVTFMGPTKLVFMSLIIHNTFCTRNTHKSVLQDRLRRKGNLLPKLLASAKRDSPSIVDQDINATPYRQGFIQTLLYFRHRRRDVKG